jgi:hypothetical protein
MFYILFHRIVGDNVDMEIAARIERKERGNKSLHWTHQFAVLDRASPVGDNRKQPRSDMTQLIELLPHSQVQENLISRMAVLVSRVVTKYIECFQPFQDVVVWNIPHKYSKEMSEKSESVS